MLDLTKLGFEEIVEQLKVKLREKDAWKDVYLSSTGTVLIELFAYVFQLLLYYLKRTYEEQFPSSAQFWSSLTRIANMLNLYVKRPQGAYGKVMMKLADNALMDTLQLSKYSPVLCGGVKCYLCEDVVLNKHEWKEVLVRQGSRTQISFVGTGDVMQEFVIDDIFASDRDIVVKVGNVYYDVVLDFFEIESEHGVRVYTDTNKKLRLQFVSDFGAPESGARIDVEYASVNPDWVPKATTLAASEWFVQDGVLAYVKDVDTWVRGSSFEPVESFRDRFVHYFGVGKRLVTKHDFEKVLLSLGEVEKIKVIDVKDEYKAPFRSVVLCVKLKDSWTIPDAFLEFFNTEILRRIGLLGTKVYVWPPSKVDVDVYVVVDRKYGYSVNEIVSKLSEEIAKTYANAAIGEWISRDELYSIVVRNGFSPRKIVLPQMDLVLKETQLVCLRACRVDVM